MRESSDAFVSLEHAAVFGHEAVSGGCGSSLRRRGGLQGSFQIREGSAYRFKLRFRFGQFGLVACEQNLGLEKLFMALDRLCGLLGAFGLPELGLEGSLGRLCGGFDPDAVCKVAGQSVESPAPAQCFVQLFRGFFHGGHLERELGHRLFQRPTILVGENLHALESGDGHVKTVAGASVFLEDLHADGRIKIRPRDLFEEICTLVVGSLEEVGEGALRKQHRAGEDREGHARDALDLAFPQALLTGDDASRPVFGACEGHKLDFVFGKPARTLRAPAPSRQVLAAVRLESNGRAFPLRHDGAGVGSLELDVCVRHAGRRGIKRERDGVENRRLAAARRADDGKKRTAPEVGVREVDLPGARK
jgi:hypothetical protein